jgi:predicted Zn-dependent protease
MRKRMSTRLVALCGGILFAACAVNPVTGQREIIVMSTEREAAIGREAAAQVEQEIGLVQDPELTAYIAGIGDQLAAFSPRRDVAYQFAIADMPEPNAFALPGGYVYVSRGLLALSNSEAELANVIGHEIGHVAARHAAQRETRSLGTGLLTVLGAIVAEATAGVPVAQTVGQLGQLASAGLIASYSRGQERQADEIGQDLASQAGWDPGAMASFLDALERETRLQTGSTRMPSFLDSHPATSERVQATAARARSLPAGRAYQRVPTHAAFLDQLRGILIGPDPKEGVFRGQLFLHPGLNLALQFPDGWETVNQKQAVAAQPPQRDALLVLETQGTSNDPQAAAAEFAEANRIALEAGQATRIGGFPAYRARAKAGSEASGVVLEISWIAHPRAMVRVTGAAPAAVFGARAAELQRATASFRALSQAERESLRAVRLEVATARDGESLAALCERTRNQWRVEETAVMNAIDAGTRLKSNQRIKIAVEAERVAD